MSDELIYTGYPSETGLTIVAKIYGPSGQVGSNIAMTEAGSEGVYFGDMPGSTPKAIYPIRFYSGSDVLGFSSIDWTGSDVKDVWDETIEGDYTAGDLMRLMSSALAGRITGALNGKNGTAEIFDVSNTKVRLTIGYDAAGNRLSVTPDAD